MNTINLLINFNILRQKKNDLNVYNKPDYKK